MGKMQLTVSLLPVFEKRASAKKWILSIKGLADHAAKFKVGKVIPLDNGATLRVGFFDMQLKDFEEFILPALCTVARVQCIGDIEAKEQLQRDKALELVVERSVQLSVQSRNARCLWRNYWICTETVAVAQKREKSYVKSLTCSPRVKGLLHPV